MATNCNLTLTNLSTPEFCERVTSGVRRLLFVPLADVDAINAVITASPDAPDDYVVVGSAAMTNKAVTLQSGCEFAEIFAAKDLGELKYTVQGSKDNRSFHATLEVHHPGFRRKMLGFLGIAVNLEFVVFAQLANGNWHMLGDADRGAVLADGIEATSGKARTDQNGATMTFEYDCPLPRIMFEDWSPDNATYGIEMYRIAYLLADENSVVLTDENNVPLEITVY